MKKSVILLLVLMAAMTVKAQTVGEITDSVKAGLKAGSIKGAVNTIKGAFEKKSAEASQIVGTWTFVESAVMVTSGRLLAKAAGNLVDDKLKDLLDDYFERSELRVPFRNMVYIGDSDTDIPCMKLVTSYDGHAIGVYDPKKGDARVRQLMREGRIRYFAPADYTEGGELDTLIRDIIASTAASEKLERKHDECAKRQRDEG